MIRNHKWKIILASVITLLPILVGLLLWDSLPDPMPTHWGVDGQVDGWSSKPVAIFGLPLFLVVIQWFCIFFTSKDPKNAEQNNKIMGMIPWLVPMLSVLVNGMMYAAALGVVFDMFTILFLFMGLLFAVIGNYLPKCKQSYTIGIKISWTLNSEANWLATHRFAGRIWTVCGVLLMATAFLPVTFAFFCSLVLFTAMAVVPIVYSYRFYKKEQAAQKDPESPQG